MRMTARIVAALAALAVAHAFAPHAGCRAVGAPQQRIGPAVPTGRGRAHIFGRAPFSARPSDDDRTHGDQIDSSAAPFAAWPPAFAAWPPARGLAAAAGLACLAAFAVAAPAQAAEVVKFQAPDLGEGVGINGFSHDALVFLAATVVVTPVSRILNASPILGYLVAGVILGPAGFNQFQSIEIDDDLAEIGILFLLFEQGLELTLERLDKLKVYAFGLGTAQLVLCSLIFGAFPFVGGVELLESLVGAKPELVSITRPDEAIVIGCALSLSSSAFVLRLLQEKKQSDSTFAIACLGVLLMQDVAVVPLLVMLPIIESTQVSGFEADIGALATSAATSLALLGGILVGGRVVLRRVFAAVAGAKSSETFVALCLLVVLGTGALTDAAGLSSTLGAFVAGVLLAETNYRARIEVDIQPFRGLLLGLFFVTTGAAVDPSLLISEGPTAVALIAGLLAVKIAVVAFFGRFVFALSSGDAVRSALLLAGGGEFAFVVLTLATRLEVLPEPLAKLDTAIVVVSMALTPALGALGDFLGDKLDAYDDSRKPPAVFSEVFYCDVDKLPVPRLKAKKGVVIRGFGPEGQTVASVLSRADVRLDYCALEANVPRVAEAAARGLPVAYGDVSPLLLEAIFGDTELAAFVLPDADEAEVQSLRALYPGVTIVASRIAPHRNSLDDAAPSRRGVVSSLTLFDAGCDAVVDSQLEPALQLAAEVLRQHTSLDEAAIEKVTCSVRSDIMTRARNDVFRNGQAMTTVSGGGIDIDPDAPGGLAPGSRARAARDLAIYSGTDDVVRSKRKADSTIVVASE